jgi:hypothetical protein
MILIESLKCREVEGPLWTIRHFDPYAADGGDVIDETIVGETFVTANGRRIDLGMPRKVRDVLGLPLGTFQAQRNENESLARQNFQMRLDLNRYKRMTWRQRLGFLFNRGGRR